MSGRARTARPRGVRRGRLALVSTQDVAAFVSAVHLAAYRPHGTTPRKYRRQARRLRTRQPFVRAGLMRMKALVLLLGLTAFATACSLGAGDSQVLGQQRGFALPTYAQDGYDTVHISSYLYQISDIGAEWVQLNPTWYQAGAHASEVAPTPQTPSDSSIERVILLAHEAGLKVLLKPHVDLTDGMSRGAIRPDDRPAWFASYEAFIGHYADLAARTKVDQFSVGTELAGISDDRTGWLGVVKVVRARYTGPLLYAANFDEYRTVQFWDALDLVGVDAYWKLTDQPTTDVTRLQEAWGHIQVDLRGFAAQTGRKILFSEAGYTSQRGTTTAPFKPRVSSTPDQAEQAAAYQALLTSFQDQPWWAGVFWWYWAVPLDHSANDALSYTPHGKAAENVVRGWWSKAGKLPGAER